MQSLKVASPFVIKRFKKYVYIYHINNKYLQALQMSFLKQNVKFGENSSRDHKLVTLAFGTATKNVNIYIHTIKCLSRYTVVFVYHFVIVRT